MATDKVDPSVSSREEKHFSQVSEKKVLFLKLLNCGKRNCILHIQRGSPQWTDRAKYKFNMGGV